MTSEHWTDEKYDWLADRAEASLRMAAVIMKTTESNIRSNRPYSLSMAKSMGKMGELIPMLGQLMEATNRSLNSVKVREP